MTTPILTGIHYDMAERDYRLATAIAGSDAKHILPPKTPAHYAAHMAGELKREPSKAMLLGTMAHLAVLEPQKLDTAFVERPEGIDLRTKLGKEWKESVGTMPVLDQDEARAVRGIRDSIAAHSAARELLAETQSEVALFGEHRTGLQIKGRVDALKVVDDLECVIVRREDHQRGRRLQHVLAPSGLAQLPRQRGMVLPPLRAEWVAAG
jgi:hypothetical protein